MLSPLLRKTKTLLPKKIEQSKSPAATMVKMNLKRMLFLRFSENTDISIARSLRILEPLKGNYSSDALISAQRSLRLF